VIPDEVPTDITSGAVLDPFDDAIVWCEVKSKGHGITIFYYAKSGRIFIHGWVNIAADRKIAQNRGIERYKSWGL